MSHEIFAAEATLKERLGGVSTVQFAPMVRGALADFATRHHPLSELAVIFDAVLKRGDFPELHALVLRKARETVAVADLPERYSLREVIAFWAACAGDSKADELADLAATAVRRIARGIDYADLQAAFLAVSPEVPTVRLDGSANAEREMLFWLLSDRWLEREIAEWQREAGEKLQLPSVCGRFAGAGARAAPGVYRGMEGGVALPDLAGCRSERLGCGLKSLVQICCHHA